MSNMEFSVVKTKRNNVPAFQVLVSFETGEKFLHWTKSSETEAWNLRDLYNHSDFLNFLSLEYCKKKNAVWYPLVT